jgi:hypothetical protein
MKQDDRSNKTEWYKHGWGLVFVVLFFPYFIVWYAWAKSGWAKWTKIAVTSLMIVAALSGIISVFTADTTSQQAGQASTESSNQDKAAVTEQQETNTSESAVNTMPENPEPAVTVGQKNAVDKAKDYISYSPFSYEGLIAQLEYEKFSPEEARYGADNSGADWMEQAAKKAQDYMNYSSFSRGSLIDQLEYDKFTPEQAAHGADSVGL